MGIPNNTMGYKVLPGTGRVGQLKSPNTSRLQMDWDGLAQQAKRMCYFPESLWGNHQTSWPPQTFIESTQFLLFLHFPHLLCAPLYIKYGRIDEQKPNWMTTSSKTQTIALQNINWGDNSGKLIKFEAIHFQLEILKCDYKVIEYSETRMLYILSSVLWQNTMQEKKKVEEYFNIHYFSIYTWSNGRCTSRHT